MTKEEIRYLMKGGFTVTEIMEMDVPTPTPEPPKTTTPTPDEPTLGDNPEIADDTAPIECLVDPLPDEPKPEPKPEPKKRFKFFQTPEPTSLNDEVSNILKNM